MHITFHAFKFPFAFSAVYSRQWEQKQKPRNLIYVDNGISKSCNNASPQRHLPCNIRVA
ncbi:hypothetical protein AHF37_09128 [Paragonimus kellicotti]|nr:hypothetical protein AHF37_09128 [Paragonimus kellicotti]